MKHNVIMKEHRTNETSDGWKLPLLQYSSDDALHVPVILCHGLAANKHSVDFGHFKDKEWKQYSLACYLSSYLNERDNAFDVWVAQLRGRGNTPTFDPEKHPEKYHWTVDDYVTKDIPTIIRYVQEWYSTNKSYIPKVYWIGKSMGGMIAYAYGETEEGFHNLKGVVTLGSPTAFEYWNTMIEILARMAPRNLSFPINPSEFLQSHPHIKERFMETAANKENVEDGLLEQYIEIGMNNNISSKVLNQFMVFYRHNDFCKYPKQPWIFDILGRIPILKQLISPYSYKQNLTRFKTPLLAIAGGNDNAAPPQDVQYASSHVGSQDVTYHNFSKKSGYEHDYGHFDLNMGVNVQDEVYKYIYEWLNNQDTVNVSRDK